MRKNRSGSEISFSFRLVKVGINQTKLKRINGMIEGAATISDCKT